MTFDGKGSTWFGSYNATQRRQGEWKEFSKVKRETGVSPTGRGHCLGFSDLLLRPREDPNETDGEPESEDQDSDDDGEAQPEDDPQETPEPVVEIIAKDDLVRRVRAAARAAVYGTPCTPARVARGVYAAKLEMRSKECTAAMQEHSLTPEQVLDVAVEGIMVPTKREAELGLVDERQMRRINNVNALLLSNHIRICGEYQTFAWGWAILCLALGSVAVIVGLAAGGPILAVGLGVLTAGIIYRCCWSDEAYYRKQKLGG